MRITLKRRSETLQSARAEAEAIERARKRFLASLSHELRLPLDAIHLALAVVGQTEGKSSAFRRGCDHFLPE